MPISRKNIIRSAVTGSKGPRYGGPKNGRKQAIKANISGNKTSGNSIKYLAGGRKRKYPNAPPGWYPGKRLSEDAHPTVKS